RREVKYGEGSRIDILLESGAQESPCFVEIKNVHLSRDPGLAEFPDSRTTRGAKHLAELARMVATGARAVNLFVVQRSDCDRFRPAADLDPDYAKALADAQRAGVELLCYDCAVTVHDVILRQRIEVDL
ncbi:MAG: DNA/RNA nuclease SfsA, partial [Pseudomonadota bacterium]